MRRAFIALDMKLGAYAKRERWAIFFFPLVLCLGAVFMVILPPIDERYRESSFHLETQKDLAAALDQIPQEHAQESMLASLTQAQNLLQSLRNASISNAILRESLSPYTSTIRTNGAELTINAVGDVSMLEDIVELLEAHRFVFIENLYINAPFASSLDMRFDVLNYGEKL